MRILKFGGSSLADAGRIQSAARIISSALADDRIVVVVSAFQGVTNQLLDCASRAEAGDKSYERVFNHIAAHHWKVYKALHRPGRSTTTRNRLTSLLRDLQDGLHGIYLLRYCPPRARDLIASFGERLSALIAASYLRQRHPSCDVDARDIIVTDDQFTHAVVQFDHTNRSVRRYFSRLYADKGPDILPIVTGFIAATEDGRTTTLGRNGSDYTAAIVAAALGASVIEIWTDVDGVLSADPRAVPTAFVVPQLSYEEAMELSYFGATVLHSATIAPAVKKNIPILIKNTLNPSAPGTLISKKTDTWQGVAKGISSIDNITLFTLRGLSMVGVPGTAERLFRALASHRVNVILISQASSEHTICFAVSTNNATAARKAMTGEFRFELQGGLTSIDEKPAQTIIAIVGDGMKGTPGVAGRVFQSIGRNRINVSAIAQGASERNISFVIDAIQKAHTLKVVHQAFFEKRKRLALVVVGVGNIGTALLRQLQQQRLFLLSQGFDVRVCGLADSKRYVLSADDIDLSSWGALLQKSRTRMNAPQLAREVAELHFADAALVDCTASSELVDAYPDFIAANMHIITPNKKANVLPWRKYTQLLDQLKAREKHFLYEANVGAGLPIISTLKDLIASGDAIIKIEGILSGTLGYLFNVYDGTQPFSACVRQARRLGFTEPDPRDDLSGEDVARKLLILGRQLGWKMELKDIPTENLVPTSLRRGTFSPRFFVRFSLRDSLMKERLTKARSHGAVLRYVGTLENHTATARLMEVPLDHPFAAARGSDNIITFTTQRYSDMPLVIHGPGAGSDVTAMGVFSDILKLLHYITD